MDLFKLSPMPWRASLSTLLAVSASPEQESQRRGQEEEK